jgi:sulfur transfer complex TusBCD TusB component (DsrH family)
MAEAEAAQQALLNSGTLAEQAQGSPTLKGILVTYGDVQRLHHKAMLPHLRRHQQLSGTPAGLAYAMLCDVLAQPLAKQVGDQITNIELQQLVEQVQQLSSLQAQHPVTLLAIEIATALNIRSVELSTLDMCVMRDVISMLAGDSERSPAAAASTAGGL